MPAYTVAQLEGILGTGVYRYVDPQGDFTQALRQVLPRLYKMGLWPDLVYETSVSGKYGYISLPSGTDSILACTVNNLPRPVRSLWHDIRITGRSAALSTAYGIVDDGFHPVMLDMKDAQGVDSVDDVTPVSEIFIVPSGDTVTTWASDPEGTVTVVTDNSTTQGYQTTEATWAVSPGDWVVSPDDTFSRITEIRYEGITETLDVLLDGFGDGPVVLATIPPGSGVLRFRRFRTPVKHDSTVVHLLLKRDAPSDLTDETVVHLSSIEAIKHGLLGLIAEDNADLQRAEYHWTTAGKLLDQELLSVLGAAKPALSIDLSGGRSALPIHNLY